MKVIITYASAGAGHFRAAQAVYLYLKEKYPSLGLSLIDILKYTNRFSKLNYLYGYSFLIRYLPHFWYAGYWLTSVRFLRFLTRGLTRFFNGTSSNRFREFIIQENPDCIVSTHFFPSEICANLKSTGSIASRLITVITDFTLHPFWISKGTDIYIAASAETKRQLLREGIEEENIKDSGIPVSQKFLKSLDREEITERLGLRNEFTVLIMTGSFGFGPLERIVENLSKDAQLIVICAANKKLYAKLKRKNTPGTYVFGYVENIQELMAVSDIIISKPGGLSISEALIMELIPIFISAIPGQETGNAKVLLSQGIGFMPKKISEIRNIVLNFKNHPEMSEVIRNRIRKLKKPHCLEEIAKCCMQK
jgi:processive 1,2-diacylglycerol beta-glucosyltransferase